MTDGRLVDPVKPVMVYTHESGVTAKWDGGPEIILGYTELIDEGMSVRLVYNELGTVNIWDETTGQPRIATTLESFKAAVDRGMDIIDDGLKDLIRQLTSK